MKDNFSSEENARESKRLYEMLDNGVREQLMKYPGVRHVSVGLKITGNETRLERCFHVYTDKKLSKAELKKEDIVPAEINGIKTDVHEIGTASLATVCEDSSRYRPIKGGISISNGTEFGLGGQLVSQFGTLGVIGRTTGACKCNTMALTNWHVLYVGRPNLLYHISEGSRVFQPTAVSAQDGIFDINGPDPNTKDNDIGKVIDGVFNTTVDVGLFEVNRSCCNCCGVDYANVIRDLDTISPINFNGVTGTERANTGDLVFFVGAKSGPTKGRVVTDSAPKHIDFPNALIADVRIADSATGSTVRDFTGQIKIQLEGTHTCNSSIPMPSTYTGPPISRIVDHGDSGSLLVNERNKAVGLVFATDDAIPASAPFTLFGYANHYADVIAALHTIGHDFEINYSQPSTGGSRGPTTGSFFGGDNEFLQEWKARIEAQPKARAIADAVSRHRDEVMLLINHCRPVTVAWHRGKGPAFAASIANNVREGKFEYPAAINGITAEQLLHRLRPVLLEHGSQGLRDDLYQFGDDILEAVKDKTSFEEAMASMGGRLQPFKQ